MASKFSKTLKKVSKSFKKVAGWVLPAVATVFTGPGGGAVVSAALAGVTAKSQGAQAGLKVLGQGVGATIATDWATGAIDRAIDNAGQAAADAAGASGQNASIQSPANPKTTGISWNTSSMAKGGSKFIWVAVLIALIAFLMFYFKPWRHLKFAAA